MFCKVTKTQILRTDFLLALIKGMCKPKVHTVRLSEHTSEASQQQISDASKKRKQCQFSTYKNKSILTDKKCGKVCSGSHTGKKVAVVTCSCCIN